MNIKFCVDDFGLSPFVNNAVFELAEEKKIHSVSIMTHPNSDLCDIQKLLKFNIDFGPHIVLSGEKSFTLPFYAHSYSELFLKSTLSNFSVQLDKEIRLQLDSYNQLNIPLNFINSHQHVHMFPRIWSLFQKIVQDNEIPSIRASGFLDLTPGKQILTYLSSRLSIQLSPISGKNLLHSYGIQYAGNLNEHNLVKIAKRLAHSLQNRKPQLSEIIFHPGLNNFNLEKSYGGWNFNWQEEFRVLKSGVAQRIFEDNGFTFSNI